MNILNKLAVLLRKFPMKSIMIAMIVVAILAVGVSKISMATDNDTLVKTQTDVYQDNLELEAEFGGESIMVLYEAANLLTPSHLKHMKGIVHALDSNKSIYSIISPVTLVEAIAKKQSATFQTGISETNNGLDEMGGQLIELSEELAGGANNNTNVNTAHKEINDPQIKNEQKKQAERLGKLGNGLFKMGERLQKNSDNIGTIENYSDIMTPGLPKTQKTLDNMIYEDGELRTMFEEVVLDDHHMLMMIKFAGTTNDAEKSAAIAIINNYLEIETLDSAEIIVSGKPVLDNRIRSSMQESIQKMMALALLIMVIILSFAFKVRWRLLPLLIVLVAVIGTVGLMGWLQIPLTMVSMAVFPILIGLGIDYAIQFHNRYTEEMAKEDSHE